MTQEPSHPYPGRLITLDGIDGVGKSSQIEILTERLRSEGREVLCVRDPGSTDLGTKLRAMLLDSDLQMHRRTEAMLFMASRCEMIESTLRSALADGVTVISDRFLLANVVYQSVGGEVDSQTLWRLGRLACGGIQPDVTLLLDLPAEISMRRVGGEPDRMESRGVDYMAKVRQAFLDELPNAGGRTHVIDASGTIERVAEAIAAIELF
ncbi:dTMP kinase [Rhodopirellula bahusiensis]|uniref:Thymidylate kinase n=1 Tax=Rhodopirellula bahusiensis TaxID=2014065 RepID=A0A2G1VZY9_9BACT|nr:dTMP kinase [Rhodopirellula bahusiensis]PHQ31989.1 dTMP kinase [Rhodopirellula bahusiensis]